ncbi:MarR family transcriptional regulator [Nocardioides sp. B-3]|nr:MarR family transcriptional regulator [Nocardioides sp. B-3]UUZ59443.1 MarR family transcriptional regulator [Nocardioides sp. B-3]
MSRHPQLDLDAQLCFPLYAASRAVTRAYGPLLQDHGLTYPQYLALLALWDEGEPMTVGELGSRLRLDSGTLTPAPQAARAGRLRHPPTRRGRRTAGAGRGHRRRAGPAGSGLRRSHPSGGVSGPERDRVPAAAPAPGSLPDRLDADLPASTTG